MSNFLKTTNKSGAIGTGLIIIGAICFLLWAIRGEYGTEWAKHFWVLAILFFIAGVGYIASKSGRKGQ